MPLPVEDVEPAVFTSMDEAREIAARLGRPIDIFRTPSDGGIAEFVQTVHGRDATVTPKTVVAKADVMLPSIEVSAEGEVKARVESEPTTTVGKSLELRWNVEAPTDVHVRQLFFHPPSKKGEPWRVDAMDESGHVLASGMGTPEDAYLELWEEMRPPDA